MDHYSSEIQSHEHSQEQSHSGFTPKDEAGVVRAWGESLMREAADLLAKAVAQAVAEPSTVAPPALVELRGLAKANMGRLKMSCVVDVLELILPRSSTLTLMAYSAECIRIRGFDVIVTVRPFFIMSYGVHVEVQSVDRRPLPFTETGYQSAFVPFAAVGTDAELRAYLAEMFTTDPIQVGLF